MESVSVEKEAKKEAKKSSKQAKKEPSTERAEKIIAKYKGIKNRINKTPSIETHGSSTTSSHIAGDENVHQ